ncbi:HAMP domain-containing histidine kinase (plasmid) [Rhodococcus sp. ZPP]|uniref:sensor histidine kinase n=1 Tax=unclassified Rhodococcus (in: high G+C Gram-positive bacteria) TaxID=192944 RepID=UPI001359D594|nr:MULTISPECIES: HAMP domain-containing sensor histidine kinase [unclassified Rhodococcus (in: high G+C Gram-positive bacteria)]QTJ71039.1 HAMP domain-containing histidine kinase [Rhodococcus sp. ZPP]
MSVTLNTMDRRSLNPERWNVRVRSTAAAVLAVTVCLLLAGGALLFVLYRTLEHSARGAADSRAHQIIEQLHTQPPQELDPSLLATDGQIGAIQILDNHGNVLATSTGIPSSPVLASPLPPGESAYLGNLHFGHDRDYWVAAHGTMSPNGPVTVVTGADREPVEGVLATVAALLAIGAPIVVGFAAAATYRLIGAALRPVERIRARVAAISTDQLDERVPVPAARDEIADLAVTMNSMLARLEAGHLAQRRFVSDASHELRSPLATITAALELAQSRPDLIDTALVDESLLPEARRMHALLEDLLLLARADEDSLTHLRVDVDIDDLILAERARLRGLPGIAVAAAVDPVRVAGDPEQLARLVRNLVDNAVRHAHTRIALACRRCEGSAVIEVVDDGPGIAPADRARIFERFVRLDTPRTRASGGSGLGLAIAAEIVAAHHGSIEVRDHEGGGAHFVVTLPIGDDSYSSDRIE